MTRRRKIAIAVLAAGAIMLIGVALLPHRYRAYISRIVDKVESIFVDRDTFIDDTNYSRLFNDMNGAHLSSAKRLGIERPIKSRDEADSELDNLVKISNNKHYTVDYLTHSIPYLTNGAAELLEMIGSEFTRAVEEEGYKASRIIVTSVLRTQEDVRKLQKSGNVNASSNSAHCYATTFDITYARFDRGTKFQPLRKAAQTKRLKKILGDVLHELHKEGKCYIKYEINQHCFHITSRI